MKKKPVTKQKPQRKAVSKAVVKAKTSFSKSRKAPVKKVAAPAPVDNAPITTALKDIMPDLRITIGLNNVDLAAHPIMAAHLKQMEDNLNNHPTVALTLCAIIGTMVMKDGGPSMPEAATPDAPQAEGFDDLV